MLASAVKHFTYQCARASKCFNTKPNASTQNTMFKRHILITSKEITIQIQLYIRIRGKITKIKS